MPFLLFFTALCIVPTFFIAASTPRPRAGPVHRRELRLPGRADLLRRDAQDGQLPGDAAASCPGSGPAIGYCGTVFVGLLIFFLDVPVADRFRLAALLFADLRDPDLRVRPRAADRPAQQPSRVRESATPSGQLRRSIAHAREVPGLGRFLLGRFFYSDAVNTVIVVMSIVDVQTMGCRRRAPATSSCCC